MRKNLKRHSGLTLKRIVIFVPVVFAVIFYFSIPRIIKINEVECLNQYGECGDYYRDLMKGVEKKSYYSAKQLLKDKLGRDKAISNYAYRLQLPSKLIVNIIERKAEYALKISGSDELLLYDKDGVLIRVSNDTNLPFIDLDREIEREDNLDSRYLFASQIYYNAYVSFNALSAKIENDSLELKLPGEVIAIFPLEGDKKVLLGSLSLIYSKIRTDGEDDDGLKDKCLAGCIIDLRFKNPVIR